MTSSFLGTCFDVSLYSTGVVDCWFPRRGRDDRSLSAPGIDTSDRSFGDSVMENERRDTSRQLRWTGDTLLQRRRHKQQTA